MGLDSVWEAGQIFVAELDGDAYVDDCGTCVCGTTSTGACTDSGDELVINCTAGCGGDFANDGTDKGIFMGKDGLKMYPLNRYVLERDGNGNVIEIVTKERINKKLIESEIWHL